MLIYAYILNGQIEVSRITMTIDTDFKIYRIIYVKKRFGHIGVDGVKDFVTTALNT